MTKEVSVRGKGRSPSYAEDEARKKKRRECVKYYDIKEKVDEKRMALFAIFRR